MLYFAYGANMNKKSMLSRCPTAKYMGLGYISNYQFMIMEYGYATIIPKKNEKVFGVIWDLTKEDFELLDMYEGVSNNLYYKQEVETITYLNENNDNVSDETYFDCVIKYKEQKQNMLVYISTSTKIGQPFKHYINDIYNECLKYKFDPNYCFNHICLNFVVNSIKFKK